MVAAVLAVGLVAGGAAASDPRDDANRLQSAIAHEDAAAAAISDHSAAAAIRELDAAAAGLDVAYHSEVVGAGAQKEIAEAYGDDVVVYTDLKKNGIPDNPRHLLETLAKARVLKVSALKELRTAIAHLNPVTETFNVPTPAGDAPAVEVVAVRLLVPAPVLKVESVIEDIRAGTQGVVGVYERPTTRGFEVEIDAFGVFDGTAGPGQMAKVTFETSTDRLLREAAKAAKPDVLQVASQLELTHFCDAGGPQAHFKLVYVKPATRAGGATTSPTALRQACAAMHVPAGTAQHAAYSCNGQIVKLFTSFTGTAVVNGGARPSFSTGGKPYCLTAIQTYHWNKGAGTAPGTLGLAHVSGPAGFGSVGPFAAVGSAGQNNAPNVNWQADVPTSPKPTVIDGTYTCTDSDPATWSAVAGGRTFCAVYGIPAQAG